MPGFRRNQVKKTITKKANPYIMNPEQFEHFTRTNTKEAIDFCHSQSRDFARQGDTEMSRYWQERAQKIKEKQ